MVQLRLESTDAGIPKDCYVSVRVGEVQKLSRLSGSRTYKFPQTDKHRFGKIEVFRRVGSASIDLNPIVQGAREVQINTDDMGAIGLRIGVDGQFSDPDPKQVEEDEKAHAKNNAGRVKAAKEYLNNHNLEVLLSEAMQAVLRDRPENPAEVLAAKLLAGAKARFIKKPPAPIQVQQQPAEAQLARSTLKTQPFNDYFKASFQSCSFAGIHERFPTYQEAKKKAIASKVLSVLPFANYYSGSFASVPAAGMSKMYERFASYQTAVKKAAPPASTLRSFKFRPSVGSWLIGKQPQVEQVKAAPRAAPAAAAAPMPSFALRPSVGTWLMCKPVKQLGEEPAARNFVFKPSVGSWLVHLPIVAAPATVAPAPPAKATSAPSAAPFKLRPSVGTWLAPKPKPIAVAPKAKAAAKAPEPTFHKLPSTGTWLARKPAPIYRPQVQSVFHLVGLRPSAAMSHHEKGEAERVLTKALLELTGELAGDYYPLAGSMSYPTCLGGMTKDEELSLQAKSLLFKSRCADTSGQGVFDGSSGRVSARINDGDGHLRFVVMQTGPEADLKLKYFENVVAAALKQDGYVLK
mmetsp:Transcript_129775/g.416380  ORF Transcript_129775/g.416380 Transcript_129775/m.416380 type:complete len:576 (-) Transcript_129775:322-2049(-)